MLPSYEPSWLAVLGTRRKNKIQFNSSDEVFICMCPAVPHVVAEVLKEDVALDVSYGPATSITVRYVHL